MNYIFFEIDDANVLSPGTCHDDFISGRWHLSGRGVVVGSEDDDRERIIGFSIESHVW